ncbi:uncharacterized protein [Solanum lycopersicum]|uniref:uncharacterized protein n=1 Tax=Solanum lycopersicum TaxID=4081 RepID=UPI0037481E7F
MEWDIKLNVDDDMDYSYDDIDRLLNDQFRDVAQAGGVYDGPNENAKKFYSLLEEANQELYAGCIELLKEAMPELNIPQSYSKTKSMVKNLGLDYGKIDACQNDCMLFRNDHKDDEFCHTCGASRYIQDPTVDSELESLKKQHRVSAKTLRHFPLIPRIKRLFMCSKTVDSLRWNEEERFEDGKLRHPADGLAWKDFDRVHPGFAQDCCNVRLGLSIDGFNPFRTMRKTKDHAKARYDLKDMGIMKNLHPQDTEDSKRTKFTKAFFSMTNGEKSIFCGVLKTAKLPDGSASNISSILPDHVAIPLIRLRSFFHRLCQKVITVEDLDCLEVEIIEIVNQFERIFPPSFFDIMIHLPIHLVNEVRLGGPVQNQWMYSTEREMGTFKSYIRNRRFPEGCIAETRVEIDCMNLFSKYLHRGVHTIFNRRARNNDECEPCDAEPVSLFSSIGVPLGAKKIDRIILDDKSLSQAHAYLLGNCDDVQEYIREHEQEVNNQSRRSKWSKAKNHCQNFSQWFETRALQEVVPDLIKQLSRGPYSVAKRYSGYLINGYRFHVRKRDARRKTKNSGVTLIASTTSFASSKDKNPIAADLTYYGRIVDIVELIYYNYFKVVLFKCDWYEVEKDVYGLTYVYFNKRCSQEEPFVLASQVHQCFHVQDPYDQDKHYVMKTVPSDLFNMGDEVESNLPQSYENEPSEHSKGPSIPKDSGEVLLTRTNLPETIIDVPVEQFVNQQLDVESEDEF